MAKSKLAQTSIGEKYIKKKKKKSQGQYYISGLFVEKYPMS